MNSVHYVNQALVKPVTSTTWKQRPGLIMAAILIFAAASRLGTAWMGTNIDEGYFLLQGREIVRGYIPVLETQINKGPLIAWLTAPLFLISDTPFIPARILTVLVSILGIWGTARLAGKWWGAQAAILSAAWYAGESFSALWGKSLHVSVLLPVFSVWVLNFVEVGIQTCSNNTRKLRRSLEFFCAAGLLLGLAGLLKQTAIFLVPVLGLRLFLAYGIRRALLPILWIGGSAALIWIPLLGMYALAGELGNFLDDLIFAHMRMSTGFDQPTSFRLAEIRAVMQMTPALWLAAVLGTLAAIAMRHRLGLIATGWLVVELIGNGFLLSHVWRHYMLSVVPPAALLAGYLSASLLMAAENRKKHLARFGSLVLAALLIIVACVLSWPKQDWSYPGLTLRDEKNQSRFIQNKIQGTTLLNFTNPSTLIWTGQELPWSTIPGRRIRIPGIYPMISRGYLTQVQVEELVQSWKKQDIDGAAILGIHLRPLQDNPVLLPLWNYLNSDFDLTFAAKPQNSYYKEILVYTPKTTGGL